MPYNSRADIVRLLAERYDTKSNINLGGFRSQLQASYVYSHTEELWNNEIVRLWITIYIYIYICYCRYSGTVFQVIKKWIVLFIIVLRIVYMQVDWRIYCVPIWCLSTPYLGTCVYIDLCMRSFTIIQLYYLYVNL